jgi:HEAT repeats
MTTIQTLPLQVLGLPDWSSTDDPAKTYANYRPAPSRSDTSDHNMLRYTKASKSVHNYDNVVYVGDRVSVENECKYVIRLLRESAINSTVISSTRFSISGTTSFNETASREASVILLPANLHAAPFDSSAGQYYGVTEAVATHLNVSADRVNEPPEYEIINRLFSMEPMPDFEDGVSNAFSEGIDYIVKVFGIEGVEALEVSLVSTDNVSCVAEALRTLGLIDDAKTAERRLRTLVKLLKHSSAIVRDAAAIGLAYLDDHRAIPAINEAIETEPLSFLRRDMEAIREQLAHR